MSRLRTFAATVLAVPALASLAWAVCVEYSLPHALTNWEFPQTYAWNITPVGNRMYACTQKLTILDVSWDRVPRVVQEVQMPPGTGAHDVAVAGSYAYIAALTALVVVDVSDPDSARVVGSVGLPDPSNRAAVSITVSGTHAYMADLGTGPGIVIVDISNPAQPVYLGAVGAPAASVKVSGSYLYAASLDGVQVYSLSNPALPSPVGGQVASGFGDAVAVSGGRLYACGLGGLAVLNLTNPATPQLAGSVALSGGGFLAVQGTTACVSGAYPGHTYVIDVSTPQVPRIVSSVPGPANPGYAMGVALAGAPLRAYQLYDPPIGLYPVSLSVIDVRGASVIDSEPAVAARDVAVNGNFAYVTDGSGGFRVFDTSSGALVQTEVLPLTGNCRRVALSASGQIAYVTDGPSGLQTVLLSISEVFTTNTPGSAADVEVVGTRAYLTDAGNGFYVLDLSHLHPIVAGFVSSPYAGTWDARLAVSGSYAYVADPAVGLQLIDVSNPASPQIRSSLAMPGSASDVAVSGNFAYVVDNVGLHVVVVSNPLNPHIVGNLAFANTQIGIDVFGNVAYVAEGSTGRVTAVDISDPLNPRILGSLTYSPQLGLTPYDVTAGSNRVFVAGLQAVHLLPASCQALPNLTATNVAGWFSPVVPRNATDATPSSVPLPATLTGNAPTTSFNFSAFNAGSATALTPWAAGLWVDSELRWQQPATASLPMGGFALWNNTPLGGPQSLVQGGRHLVMVIPDQWSQVSETEELDNAFADSFVWTPLDLTNLTPIIRGAPPYAYPTGGWGSPYPACDGFSAATEAAGSYWTAVGMLPNNANARYDVRMHPHSTGSRNGFGATLASSGDGYGFQFCVANYRVAAPQTFDYSVTNFVGDYPDSLTIQQADAVSLGPIINGVTHTGSFDFGAGNFLALFEFEVRPQDVGFPVDLSVNNLDPATDIRVDLLNSTSAFQSKTTAMASVNANGAGGDEHLPPVNFQQAGFYAVAISRATGGTALRTASSFEIVVSTMGSIVAAPLVESLPTEFALSTPRPNPSTGAMSVELAVPAGQGKARVVVYDLAGRRVRTLADGESTPGRRLLRWDGRDTNGNRAAAGVYFVRLETEKVRQSKKITLLR